MTVDILSKERVEEVISTVKGSVITEIVSSSIASPSDIHAFSINSEPIVQVIETSSKEKEVEIVSSSIASPSDIHAFSINSEPIVQVIETSPPKGDKGEESTILLFPVAYPISGNRMVVLNENLQIIYASNLVPAHAKKILGITTEAVISGNIKIQSSGIILEPSWNWNLDTPIWLGDNGLLLQIPPISGFCLVIGFPISSTSIFINICEPIFLEE